MSAAALALHRDPLRPPPSPGLGRGIALALVAHGLLVLGLTAGLNWRSQTEPAIEAELWAAVPVAAAPREEAPPPEPEPEPVKPQPTPEPPKPDLRAQQQEQQRDAEIAAEREKKKKVEEKKRADEEADRRKLREQELKDKKLREDKLKDEAKAKQEKAQQEAQKKKAEAALEKQRQDNLKRMMGMAGATGAPNATGTAQQSAGPSSSYGGRIKARIRPNIIYSDSGLGNPVAEAEVRAGADGTILSYRLLKTSGDAEWDKAVLRAIEKTAMLPRDVDGRVPSVLVITFQPRE